MMTKPKEETDISYLKNESGGFVLNSDGGRIICEPFPENIVTHEGNPVMYNGEYLKSDNLPDEVLIASDGTVLFSHDGTPLISALSNPADKILTLDNETLTLGGEPLSIGALSGEVEAADPVAVQDREVSAASTALSVSSSSWTGVRSITEKARLVVQLGPAVLQGVESLISCVEDARWNDPGLLEGLLSLRTALDDLIQCAKNEQDITPFLDRLRLSSDAVFGVAKQAALTMTLAPILGSGTALLLQFITGMDMTSQAFAGLTGAYVFKDVLRFGK